MLKNAWVKTLIGSLTLFTMTHSFAYTNTTNSSTSMPRLFDINWNYVLTFGAGATRTTDTGNSAYYPAANPTTDEFYSYSVNNTTSTSFLFDAFFGVEGRLLPDWLLQVGLDYTQSTPFKAAGYLVQGADIHSENFYTYDYSVQARQALVETKLLATLANQFHPYLLVGIGASFNKAYNYNTNIPTNLSFTRMYNNNSCSSFTYSVGAGVDLDVTNRVRFGIGYRFSDLGTVKLGKAIINKTTVPGTLSQPHLYTNALLAQLTWVI
jgi:opacity protein-like surface antigen